MHAWHSKDAFFVPGCSIISIYCRLGNALKLCALETEWMWLHFFSLFQPFDVQLIHDNRTSPAGYECMPECVKYSRKDETFSNSDMGLMYDFHYDAENQQFYGCPGFDNADADDFRVGNIIRKQCISFPPDGMAVVSFLASCTCQSSIIVIWSK